MPPILKVNNLSVRFHEITVIKDLHFEVGEGEVMAIIGPNGAGKTVLFRTLLGLIPHEGEIIWSRKVKIGYVPQKLAIEKELPLSVMEFLKLKSAPEEEIFEALESVGLIKSHGHPEEHHLRHHLLNARIGHLSGGELQRMLIAYAIIGHPDILLFDEPTAGIDVGGEETIYSLLEKLHKKHKLTILLISHDLNIVSQRASKVLCLNKKQVCYGPPKNILTTEALQQLYDAEVSLYQHRHGH